MNEPEEQRSPRGCHAESRVEMVERQLEGQVSTTTGRVDERHGQPRKVFSGLVRLAL